MTRRPNLMLRAAMLAGVLAVAASCSGPADEAARPVTGSEVTDPADQVHGALGALRERPLVGVTVEGTVRIDGSAASAQTVRLTGTYSGADGGRAHLRDEVSGAARSIERYLLGDDVIVTTTLPDVDRPWMRMDAAVLDAATAPDRERVLPSADEAVALLVSDREPSPVTALEVLGRASMVASAGTEEVEGRSLTRFEATTPAEAVIDVYGWAVAGQATVDCGSGAVTTVWLDGAGELVRLQYSFDHLAIDASVVMSFAGADPGATIDPPAAEDVFDLTAGVSVGAVGPPRPFAATRSRPCTASGPAAASGQWPRTCPDDDSATSPAWDQLARRARRDPQGAGAGWLAFPAPQPIDTAITVATGLRVTGFLAVYPSTGGLTTKATFEHVDASTPDVAAEQIRARAAESDDASDPRLAAIYVDGTWQAMADEVGDCTYSMPELAPWGTPPLVGIP